MEWLEFTTKIDMFTGKTVEALENIYDVTVLKVNGKKPKSNYILRHGDEIESGFYCF